MFAVSHDFVKSCLRNGRHCYSSEEHRARCIVSQRKARDEVIKKGAICAIELHSCVLCPRNHGLLGARLQVLRRRSSSLRVFEPPASLKEGAGRKQRHVIACTGRLQRLLCGCSSGSAAAAAAPNWPAMAECIFTKTNGRHGGQKSEVCKCRVGR